ncbi:MAG: hypothetical protein VXW31_08405 [Planctomycetota bacterium]|nr:hypothetical protein [Planctomycetota bacterium]
MSPVYAFSLGPISGLELLVVGVASVLIFGGRLPEVAMRAIAHVMRARRALSQMWRDTGLEDELRRVRREIETKVPRQAEFDVQPRLDTADQDPARAAAARARHASAESPGALDEDEFGIDPDADRREAYSFEPVDEAIAVGDDHVALEKPLEFAEETDHATSIEVDPEVDAPDEDGLRAS